jgi:hypothetical protein
MPEAVNEVVYNVKAGEGLQSSLKDVLEMKIFRRQKCTA